MATKSEADKKGSRRSLGATEARDQFADILRRAVYNQEETVITLHGRAVAVVAPVKSAA